MMQVGTARQFVSTTLQTWQCAHLTDTARLLTSEIITNAIRHAYGPITLRLQRTESALTIEVTDHSPCLPQSRDAGTADEAGRGLAS